MQIQINTGSDTRGNEQWMQEIERIVEGVLGRFDAQIMRVDVFISDENSREKSGDDDKRCLIEARLKGLQPIAVRTNASTFDAAVADCAEKMQRTLDRRLGRLEDKDDRTSFSGDELLGPLNGPLPETNEDDA